MIDKGNGKPIRYKIVVSGHVAKIIEQQQEFASHAGLGQQFSDVLRAIGNRLQAEPGVFGEEKYNYHQLNLQMRLAVVLPVVVEYGLHREKPLVFLRTVFFLPSQHG